MPYTHPPRSDGQPHGERAQVAAYAAHRQHLIARTLPGAAKVVLGITLVYAAVELVQSPARFTPQLVLYGFQFLIPLVELWWVRRGKHRHLDAVALGADLAYTATLASRLLLPTETTSGVALFLCLKMLGTAVLFPWSVRFQYVSASITVLLYWGLLSGSGRPIEPAAAPHQLLGPVVAAVLSVAGAASAERARRRLFLRSAKLAESESHLRSLLESIPDGILVIEAERIALANAPVVEMLGYQSSDVLLNRNVQELVPLDGRVALRSRLDRAMTDTAPRLNMYFLRADGEPLAVELTFARLSFRGRLAVQVMVRDITERKRAEERTAALLDVAKITSSTLELWEMLDRVQRRAAEVLPCDAVATFCWDSGGDTFRMIAEYGMPSQVGKQPGALEFHRGVPFVDRLTSMRTVVVNEPESQPWVPAELLATVGAVAMVWTQLHLRGRPIGALVALSTTSGRRFNANQVELFEGIARQVAVAIETMELYQAQQQEAEVFSALARVGRELISSLDQPVLLERLCRVSTEVLRCDCSHTVLLQAQENVYTAVSAFGYPPEQWEWMRVLKTPRALLSIPTAALERDVVAQFDIAADPHDALGILGRQLGIKTVLLIALRRGEALIGFLAVCSRTQQGRFTAQQERIGRGIAQLASLALDNARLMEELARASRLKSDFLATMSHELRTPLSIIMGYNDLLLEQSFGTLTPDQAETLQHMAKSEVELLGLINATLDVSRLETGRLPIERQTVDVAVLLDEIDAETRELQQKPGLRVVWDVTRGLPQLYTDPLKLKVVLKNLILNAVKFTDAGQVSVDAHVRDDGIEIRVGDTGIGIAADALSIVFEPFRQADSSLTRRHGGVGLGLYIVRRLLDLLGGTIGVDSEVGQGSIFRVWVPCSLPDAGDPPEVRGEAA